MKIFLDSYVENFYHDSYVSELTYDTEEKRVYDTELGYVNNHGPYTKHGFKYLSKEDKKTLTNLMHVEAVEMAKEHIKKEKTKFIKGDKVVFIKNGTFKNKKLKEQHKFNKGQKGEIFWINTYRYKSHYKPTTKLGIELETGQKIFVGSTNVNVIFPLTKQYVIELMNHILKNNTKEVLKRIARKQYDEWFKQREQKQN